MSVGRVRITPDRGGIRAMMTTGQGRQFVYRIGNRVLNNARARVNVDTGYLRSTGAVEQSDDVTVVVFRARYAAAVHNGHHSYPGNPYLADALIEEMSRL